MGLARNVPSLTTEGQILHYQTMPESDKKYESVPQWVADVPALETALVIPTHDGIVLEVKDDKRASKECLSNNILIWTPHILFTKRVDYYSKYIGSFHVPKWVYCALIEQSLHAQTVFDTRYSPPVIDMLYQWAAQISAPIPQSCRLARGRSPFPLDVGDVLLHAGDLTENSSFDQVQAELDWLSSQPHRYKPLVARNHEVLLDDAFLSRHQ